MNIFKLAALIFSLLIGGGINADTLNDTHRIDLNTVQSTLEALEEHVKNADVTALEKIYYQPSLRYADIPQMGVDKRIELLTENIADLKVLFNKFSGWKIDRVARKGNDFIEIMMSPIMPSSHPKKDSYVSRSLLKVELFAKKTKMGFIMFVIFRKQQSIKAPNLTFR